MSVLLPNVTELPIEILEQILLYLPGQDVARMETVREAATNSKRSSADLARYDLGQPILPKPRLQLAHPSAPMRALRRRSDRQSLLSLRFFRTPETT